jgi:4-hydroxythreonine-4-phosphate dehydrogenase
MKPIELHITCGDPTGIGPELVVRTLASGDRGAASLARPIVYGHTAQLSRIASHYDLPPLDCRIVEPAGVLDPMREPGRAQIAYLDEAIERVLDDPGRRVLVTGPISKATAHSAGFEFPGHTELLASRSKASRVAMMMAGPRLRVVLATTHLALAEVPKALTVESVGDAIFLAGESLGRDFGMARPRLAVAALNPHAGEGGAFGREEEEILCPAIRRAERELASRGRSVEISGPHPADTLFWQAVEGHFDGVVAMYHDQGLIPAKILDIHQTVNVTLGLPIIRTSPDHGVAHDLVGTGRARTDSFRTAVDLACEISEKRFPDR